MQNKNIRSAFGKWFANAVYDKGFVETKQLAEFIQTQASVKQATSSPCLTSWAVP